MNKPIALFILFLLVNGMTCQPSADRLETFWPAFQKAVAKNDPEAVADLTHFPLPGAEPFIRSQVYVAAGVLREQFIQSYDRLFDERARTVIARTRLESLDRYEVVADSYADLLGIPIGTEVHTLSVRYIYGEDTTNSTESTVSFNFVNIDGVYRLGFIELAG